MISLLFKSNVSIEFCFYVLFQSVCGRTVRRRRLLQLRAFAEVGMFSATSTKPGPLDDTHTVRSIVHKFAYSLKACYQST